MQPWVLLETAAIPDGGRLRLLRRGEEFSIRLDDGELMGSRVRGSEELLAQTGCAPVAMRARPKILIGGLGMGFTLRAALDALPSESSLVVSELVPAVVDWNRGPLSGLSHQALADNRVEVRIGDVAATIKAGRNEFDAILLDVDNGPEGLTRDSNNNLYGFPGLQAARTALTPGGILAVWSAHPSDAFTDRLRRCGFHVEIINTRANGKRGAKHVIWKARRG